MVKGRTASGFNFEVDEDLLNDFMFMRAIKKANSGDPDEQIEGTVDLVKIVFNDKKEEERFLNHLAKLHGGRVPAETIGEDIGSILSALEKSGEEAKNS